MIIKINTLTAGSKRRQRITREIDQITLSPLNCTATAHAQAVTNSKVIRQKKDAHKK